MEQAWGWAGPVEDFLALDEAEWLSALEDHHLSLLNQYPSGETLEAWREERVTLVSALQPLVDEDPDVARWSIVFEYELPLEGGRRPDAVLISEGSISVMEFKSSTQVRPADVDQVRAYRRDLEEYHEGCRGGVSSSAPSSTARRW